MGWRILGFLFVLILINVGCSESRSPSVKNDRSEAEEIKLVDALVETSCGQCQLEMSGDGCDLAIVWQGKFYWVDGSGIDDHGDAHGGDGLCNRVRQARVSGLLADGRFAAEKFEVLEVPVADDSVEPVND